MIDYRTRMLQDVLASLEQEKRREGRKFDALKKIVHKSKFDYDEITRVHARYNNLENQIAFMSDTFNLQRKWKSQKLKLEEI